MYPSGQALSGPQRNAHFGLGASKHPTPTSKTNEARARPNRTMSQNPHDAVTPTTSGPTAGATAAAPGARSSPPPASSTKNKIAAPVAAPAPMKATFDHLDSDSPSETASSYSSRT